MPPIPVLTPAQSTDWDRRAEAAGIPLDLLMESAGRAAAVVIGDRFPALLRHGTLVAAGRGNNGGDGWVLARALHRLGLPVWVAPIPGTPSPLAERAAIRARADGVREVLPGGPWPSVGVVVDALLGTGASGPPRGEVAHALERLHDTRLPLVALDGPTGLDLATGTTHGSPAAQLSITFGGLRRGHLLGRDASGDLVVVDIGHPPADGAWPRLVQDAEAGAWLPPLQARDHKGTRGRLVVIGGSEGMTGAVRMAASAAFAAGAGLVHAVVPPESRAVLAAGAPDLLTLAADPDREPDADLLRLVRGADAVVIGPGLGRDPRRRGFVAAILRAARAAVVDADALTVFAGDLAGLAQAAADVPVLLTPHPGELRTLDPTMAGTMEVDPWAVAEAAAAILGHGAVLLKGVPTVVARAGAATLTVAAGNPGLATGGSGDLLAGIAGAAMAAGLSPERAGAVAAQALGRAAEVGARRTTARALRPADVLAALPDVWRAWEVRRAVPPPPRPPILLDLPAPAVL